jgi:hypothetical protein
MPQKLKKLCSASNELLAGAYTPRAARLRSSDAHENASHWFRATYRADWSNGFRWHEAGLASGNLVLNLVKKLMKNFKRNAAVLSVALAMAAASVSQAVPTIRITDGVTTVTIQDNIGSDGSPIAGFVQYSAPAGTFAGWSVILSAGTTKPVIGSVTSPELDLNWTITRSGPGAGQLTVCFSENGFNLAGPASFVNSSGGTLGTSAANTALIRTYYAGDNVELNTANLLTTHAFNGPGAFAANDAGVAPADPSVSFTVKLDLNQGAGQVTSGDIHLRLNVPEGGSMVTFLGTALLALGFFAARRKA